MGQRYTARDPESRFAQAIAELRRQIQDLQSRPPSFPVLQADPPATDRCRMWLLYDGRLRWRRGDGTIKEWAPVTTPGASTSTVAKPAAAAQPTTTVKTYAATYGQAYHADGTQRTADKHLSWGAVDGTGEVLKSMIGFDDTTMAGDLANATILRVELKVQVLQLRAPVVTVSIGENYDTPTAPATYGSTLSGMTLADISSQGEVWIPIATQFGADVRDYLASGLVLEAPNESPSYAGAIAGVADTGYAAPQLRVTYVK